MSSISAGGRLGWTPSLPRRVEEITTWEGRKASRHEERNLAGLDEKALIAIQFCLADEVLDEFSTEKQRSRCGSDFKITI